VNVSHSWKNTGKNIKHEFDSQPNKKFLDPEDFSDSVRGLPDDFDDIIRRLRSTENGRHWEYNQGNQELTGSSMTIPCCIRYYENSHTRPMWR
jgi:hypothetical protein